MAQITVDKQYGAAGVYVNRKSVDEAKLKNIIQNKKTRSCTVFETHGTWAKHRAMM